MKHTSSRSAEEERPSPASFKFNFPKSGANLKQSYNEQSHDIKSLQVKSAQGCKILDRSCISGRIQRKGTTSTAKSQTIGMQGQN